VCAGQRGAKWRALKLSAQQPEQERRAERLEWRFEAGLPSSIEVNASSQALLDARSRLSSSPPLKLAALSAHI